MFMGNFLNFTMPSGVIGGLQNVSCIQTLLPSIIIYSSGMKTLVLRILIQDGKQTWLHFSFYIFKVISKNLYLKFMHKILKILIILQNKTVCICVFCVYWSQLDLIFRVLNLFVDICQLLKMRGLRYLSQHLILLSQRYIIRLLHVEEIQKHTGLCQISLSSTWS